MNPSADDIARIASEIESGSDPYEVPAELLEETAPKRTTNQSLYARIASMGVGEKIKLALLGNRGARALLIRDTNRMIARFVLRNPRLTEEEVLMFARNRNIDSEILREIGEHKLWPRNYQIRHALVTNPKTPLAIALHFVGMLHERDLRFLAKSKNVSATIVSQARRILAQRGKM
jgi:hypothetical protein